jgi:hypothetical protein
MQSGEVYSLEWAEKFALKEGLPVVDNKYILWTNRNHFPELNCFAPTRIGLVVRDGATACNGKLADKTLYFCDRNNYHYSCRDGVFSEYQRNCTRYLPGTGEDALEYIQRHLSSDEWNQLLILMAQLEIEPNDCLSYFCNGTPIDRLALHLLPPKRDLKFIQISFKDRTATLYRIGLPLQWRDGISLTEKYRPLKHFKMSRKASFITDEPPGDWIETNLPLFDPVELGKLPPGHKVLLVEDLYNLTALAISLRIAGYHVTIVTASKKRLCQYGDYGFSTYRYDGKFITMKIFGRYDTLLAGELYPIEPDLFKEQYTLSASKPNNLVIDPLLALYQTLLVYHSDHFLQLPVSDTCIYDHSYKPTADDPHSRLADIVRVCRYEGALPKLPSTTDPFTNLYILKSPALGAGVGTGAILKSLSDQIFAQVRDLSTESTVGTFIGIFF